MATELIRKAFRRFGILQKAYPYLEVATSMPPSDYLRWEKLRRIRAVYRYSMAGYRRLANAHDLAVAAEEAKLPGAFVECGVWKGGSIGLMASISKLYGSDRKIVLFDSFEGLPEPGDHDGDQAREYAGGRIGGKMEAIDQCVGPLDTVKELFFERLQIDKARVDFRQGWFKDTVPGSGPGIGPIAILRLDGDWYESTLVCLDGLYDQVVPGGYVIIDDYGFWEGCRKAVDEFLGRRHITVDLVRIDSTGRYFRKP